MFLKHIFNFITLSSSNSMKKQTNVLLLLTKIFLSPFHVQMYLRHNLDQFHTSWNWKEKLRTNRKEERKKKLINVNFSFIYQKAQLFNPAPAGTNFSFERFLGTFLNVSCFFSLSISFLKYKIYLKKFKK